MPFVRRDERGKITGTSATRQKDWPSVEFVEDGDAELDAYRAAKAPPPIPAVSESEALKRALIKQGTITQQKIDDERR